MKYGILGCRLHWLWFCWLLNSYIRYDTQQYLRYSLNPFLVLFGKDNPTKNSSTVSRLYSPFDRFRDLRRAQQRVVSQQDHEQRILPQHLSTERPSNRKFSVIDRSSPTKCLHGYFSRVILKTRSRRSLQLADLQSPIAHNLLPAGFLEKFKRHRRDLNSLDAASFMARWMMIHTNCTECLITLPM